MLKGLLFRKVNFKHVLNPFPESKPRKSTLLVPFMIDILGTGIFIILE